MRPSRSTWFAESLPLLIEGKELSSAQHDRGDAGFNVGTGRRGRSHGVLDRPANEKRNARAK